MGFYKFTCKWYDENTATVSTETGLVIGSHLGEAMTNIEVYFGDTIISVTLDPWDAENVLPISEEVMSMLEKEML